jgi:1,2-diacylglycerol 3-alpha-glucosyltransferase
MALGKIVFIHPFLLPYHYPRLNALDEECQKAGISLYNIQLAGSVKIYRSLIEQLHGHFNNRCLFAEQDFSTIPSQAMQPVVIETLEKIRPDVVFLYGYSLDIMRHVKSWAPKNNVASVLISDSNYADQKRYWPFELLKSLLVSRFESAFVGGTSSSLYLQSLRFPEVKIAVGYDVIDNDFFRSRNTANKENISQIREKWNLPEKYFLFVGRMIKEKNLMGLLKAYASYIDSLELDPWDLVLCGDGPEEMELRNYAQGLNEKYPKHVMFCGVVKQPELIDYYSAASCLVLPSMSESWGLVVNEALACGLPVIASERCGCAMDLVSNDVNGWQFNPEDINELTARMLQMHHLDEQARTEMGQRGEEIISKWDLKRFCSGALESAKIALDHLPSR